ncbi:MAG: hypothetical protein H8E72_01175 [Candidatus Marinimicrobia bacterium]|nr:hypothetical protein [Candidatus Neomarinimicrobiota bacterium]
MTEHELTLKILFSQISSNGLALEYHSTMDEDRFEECLNEDEYKRWKADDMSEDEIIEIKYDRCMVEWQRTKIQIKIVNYGVDGECQQDGYLHDFDFIDAYDFIRKSISDKINVRELDKGYRERSSYYPNIRLDQNDAHENTL